MWRGSVGCCHCQFVPCGHANQGRSNEGLSCCRPYLVKLLDGERIPCRRVGNRRKILLSHLLEYKRRDEAHRQEIADRLTEEAERIGLEY